MARRFTGGAEMNSATSGMEFSAVFGSPTISNTTFRSGAYSLRVNGVTTGTRKGIDQQFVITPAAGPYYARTWVRVAAVPSAITTILGWTDSTTTRLRIRLDSNGGAPRFTLQDSTGATIGSAYTGSLNTWYCIISYVFRVSNGSDSVGMIIGDEGWTYSGGFLHSAISSTATLGGTIYNYAAGGNLIAEALTDANVDVFFDDFAINDNTGTYENSFPLPTGKVIHLHPDAAGDNAQGTRGGTDTGSDWGQVSDNPTPDDATDYYILDANNDILDVSIDPGSLDARQHRITLIAVNVRFRLATTTSQPMTYNARIKGQSGGTVQAGTSVSASTTTWFTNDDTFGEKGQQLVAYVNPQHGNRWTPTDLPNVQIGVQCTDAAPDGWFSALHAVVEYQAVSSLPDFGRLHRPQILRRPRRVTP